MDGAAGYTVGGPCDFDFGTLDFGLGLYNIKVSVSDGCPHCLCEELHTETGVDNTILLNLFTNFSLQRESPFFVKAPVA